MPRKLTHEDYLQKLKDKNIEIIPLEEYKGKDTKILHECTCSNKWMVTPSSVYKNYKCGCEKLNRNKNRFKLNYAENLLIKNIKVKPLEEYKGARVKILHRCTCGNEWLTSPSNVLSGRKCGCGYDKSSFEIYKNNPTVLYYIKINNLYKIGVVKINNRFKNIKSQIIKGRYSKDIKNGFSIKILDFKIYKDGYDAYLREQEILKLYNGFRYLHESNDMNNFGGFTELFKENIDIIL